MSDAGEPWAAAIDGQDGSSWRLPLAPLGPAALPEPYSVPENPPADRLEAAARMVGVAAARPDAGRCLRQGLPATAPQLRLPACLPACLFACLPASLPPCLSPCLFT
jgi:hypothetical protein